ncbi:MAG: LysM peptidoglycan-binding domain-containing protein [Phycisphaerales bacterium]
MATAVTGTNRALAAAGVLVLVWIAVWWMTPVRPEPGVSFAHEPSSPAALTRTEAVPVEPAQPIASPGKTDWTSPPQSPAREANPRAADTPTSQAASLTDGAPAMRSYTVRAGDTLQSIARATFGDGAKWSIIARANPRVDPIKLRAGMVLQIPVDPGNLQGGAPVTSHTSNDKPAAGGTEYLVQKGDTLSEIAKQTLGTATRWQDILDANGSLLKAPEDLRPGMRLKIPAR